MRLIKIVIAAGIISVILSCIASFYSYVPVSKREPNVYYSSIGESFFISIIYIFPIFLSLGIIAFLIYVSLRKLKRFSHILKVVLSIVISASITSLTLFLLINSNKSETNDIYLIPSGYEGEVYVFYNIKGAPLVKTEDDFEVHDINEKGYFVTSTPEMDYGTVTDKYYYVDEKGNRIPINNKCVSLFGTGGFSTSYDNEEIDFIYTGFQLTNSNCGDEFMLESHGNGENVEKFIQDILKNYYGVQQ